MTGIAPSTDGPIEPSSLRERVTAASERSGLGPVREVVPLAVTGASLTYRGRFERATSVGQEVVVKVAPPGLEPVRNRDVLRQARGIRAASTIPGMRVPTVLFEDVGEPPVTPPFFAMTFELGDCVEPIFDAGIAPQPAEVRGRALCAARLLGLLHCADPRALGLDEPAISLESEIGRWLRGFMTVSDNVRGRAEEAAQLLLDAMPAELPPSFIHGDYRLGNTLCRDTEVTAVIDWEIWSLSDPRIDLAWLLLHGDPASNTNPHTRVAAGMPSSAEIVEEYEGAFGHAVEDLTWFEALVRFKQAAIGALIWKRMPAPGGPPEEAERRRQVNKVVTDAIELLGGTTRAFRNPDAR